MSRVAKRQLVTIGGYLGGLNKDADPTRLEANEMPEALNVNIGPRGEILKRGGFKRHDTNLTKRVVAMMNWRDTVSAEYLVCVLEDGAVWYTEDGGTTFTNSGENIGASFDNAVNYPVGFAAANGFLYISSRRGANVQRWAGGVGGWTNIPAMPKAQHLRWRFEQLYAANTTAEPSQLRISVPLAPEDFTTTPATFDFESDDGTEITGLASSGDDLMVFKDHAIHIFTGKVRSEFAKYRLDSLRGTVSPRSVKQVRGLICFFDRDTGVWAWDGQQFTQISEKINNYILNGQNYARAYMAASHVRRDLYYLTVCWGSSTIPNRTFVYSTLSNTWTEWDIGWFDANRHANKDMIGAIKNLPGIYEGPVGWLDNGVPYPVQFKTAWFLPGGPGSLARLRRVETSLRSTGAHVTMTLRQEYDEEPITIRSITANNPNKTNETDLIKNLDGFPRRADAHQLEFASLDDKNLQVNATNMVFTVNEDVLGEHV